MPLPRGPPCLYPAQQSSGQHPATAVAKHWPHPTARASRRRAPLASSGSYAGSRPITISPRRSTPNIDQSLRINSNVPDQGSNDQHRSATDRASDRPTLHGCEKGAERGARRPPRSRFMKPNPRSSNHLLSFPPFITFSVIASSPIRTSVSRPGANSRPGARYEPCNPEDPRCPPPAVSHGRS